MDNALYAEVEALEEQLQTSLVHQCNGSRTLAKGAADPYQYVLGLMNGQIIYYYESEIRGPWLYLKDAEFVDAGHALGRLELKRGIEVRIDQVAWSAEVGH